MKDLTGAEREELRRLEAKLLENMGKPPPERHIMAPTVAIRPRMEKAQKGKVPLVGLFFVVNGKPFVDGLPWTEVPSVAGFRTYGVGHPEYWHRLQGVGAVPLDLQYDETPRGRVNYADASGRFMLFADRCLITDNRLVSAIMNELKLPIGTRCAADDRYRCPTCAPRRSREQEKDDWDF
jgi:hypothetical protein